MADLFDLEGVSVANSIRIERIRHLGSHSSHRLGLLPTQDLALVDLVDFKPKIDQKYQFSNVKTFSKLKNSLLESLKLEKLKK